ncbi:MAG: hypothetical protein GXP08_04635 [Gammaproteobacteria bacterium]|nr:hypothetical protein [Gammaproteobacteria bacterium]
MSKKIPIDDKNGILRLPAEALKVLGDATEVFIYINSENKTLVLSASDLEIKGNNEILSDIVDLNKNVSDEDYFAPVPESFLNKNKSK